MTWLESAKSVVASEYFDFVDGLSDDLQVGEIVVIYSWSNVEERNEINEVELYLPSYMAIGNDSGDDEFLIRRDGSLDVYQCDAGAFGSVEPEKIHSNFEIWIGEGCPIPDNIDTNAIPLQSSIWLIRAPENQLRGMFELRKILGQSWPASEMKSMIDSMPSKLVQDGHPFAVSRKLEGKADYLACIGYGDSAELVVPLTSKS
ncbi:hypothetical protein [Roseibacillus persicicus]|uniref:Uncharacterized protein n=1 Tax=Roseibacillus persicicus TaxID=454148 RepID=A0A918TY05_9BACT|nr:hypothetical protein [Roseibacillus persicicus]GHC68274.1 hypothetical protein GCM10007100_40390 [Roseibacillus persicicus]